MSKRYPGNFITGNPVALSQTSNAGVWDLKDNYQATSNGTWQETDGVFEINKSLRCRYTTTGSLIKNSNLPTPTNSSKWTVSMWVKRGATAYPVTNYYNSLFGKTISASANFSLYFGYSGSNAYDNITWNFDNSYSLQTKQIFRDTSAWYHLVFVWDSNNSVATERAKIYCNGVLITDYAVDQRSQISSSKDCWNTTNTSYTGAIGASSANASTPAGSLDGYLAEFHNVDGQCLDPSYFGYFDSVTNIWQPKQYTGTWGNAGGYFPFTDNTSLTNLGRNFAGSNYLTNSTTPSSNYQSSTSSTSTTGAYGETVTVSQIIANNTINSGNSITSIWNNGTFAPPTGTAYTCSALVKPLAFPLDIQIYDNGSGTATPQITFSDANNWTPVGGNLTTYGVTKLLNGWYRIWGAFSFPASGHYQQIYSTTHPNGNGSTPCYQIYGVQKNLGATPDPLIQTSGTAAINDWATYGISLTAGTTYDSMVESPTNVFTSATDVGGVVPGNYCIWSTATGGGLRAGSAGYTSSIVTVSEGGLSTSFSTNAGYAMAMYSAGTIAMPNAGKWYWECTNLSNATVGIFKGQTLPNSGSGGGQEATIAYSAGGGWIVNSPATGTTTGTALSATTSDIIGVAVDMDGKNIYFYKNNTLMGGVTGFGNSNTGTSPTSPGNWTTDMNLWVPLRGNDTSGSGGTSTTNFGQRPFTYAPPTGYKSLNTTNIQALGTATVPLAAIQPHKFFDVSLFGGSSGNVRVQNTGFQPDLVWAKTRGQIQGHALVTSVNNGSLIQQSNNASAALTSSNPLTFNSDGFTTTTDIHTNGYNYVAWQWKQSPQSGLNIIPYTGTGTTRTITHNLGVVPSMIWLKGIDTNASGGPGKWGANEWCVQHAGMGWGYQMALNNTATSEAEGQLAAPTSSVFTVPSYGQVNYTGNRFLAYVWAEVPGFSKFGSYQANNLADGDFVWTGFRPKWIMVKMITPNNQSWEIWDSVRSGVPNGNHYGGSEKTNFALFSDDNTAESQRDGAFFFANGFKLNATGSRSNYPAGAYFIYMAFAESPHALNNRAK